MVTAVKHRRLPSLDRLPEDSYYRDMGCAVSPSCLSCPLLKCVHDETPEERAGKMQERDRAIKRRYEAMLAGGRALLDIPSLAREFNVSRRTVHRAIERCRKAGLLPGMGRYAGEPA